MQDQLKGKSMPCYQRQIFTVELDNVDAELLRKALIEAGHYLGLVSGDGLAIIETALGRVLFKVGHSKAVIQASSPEAANQLKRIYSRAVISKAAKAYGFTETVQGESIVLRKY
jgi:hypothetical protein